MYYIYQHVQLCDDSSKKYRDEPDNRRIFVHRGSERAGTESFSIGAFVKQLFLRLSRLVTGLFSSTLKQEAGIRTSL